MSRNFYYIMGGAINPIGLTIQINMSTYLMDTLGTEGIADTAITSDPIESCTDDTIPWMFIQNLPISTPCVVYINDVATDCTFDIDENGYMSFNGATCIVGDTLLFTGVSGIQLSHV